MMKLYLIPDSNSGGGTSAPITPVANTPAASVSPASSTPVSSKPAASVKTSGGAALFEIAAAGIRAENKKGPNNLAAGNRNAPDSVTKDKTFTITPDLGISVPKGEPSGSDEIPQDDTTPQPLSAEEAAQVAELNTKQAADGKLIDKQKPLVTTKPEVKAEDKFEEDTTAKLETPKPAETPKFKNTREALTAGMDNADKAFAKHMSESAIKHFTARVKTFQDKIAEKEAQLTQIEQTGLPLSYQNHPEAYRLSPEYSRLENEAGTIDFEANHWRQQLLAIKDQQPWRAIEGYNKQTGEPIYSTYYKPSSASEVDVNAAWQQALQLKSQNQQQLGQLQGSFKQKYEAGVKAVDAEINKHLGWLLTPETLAAKVQFNGKEVPVKQLFDNFNSRVLPEHRDHPMTKTSAALFAAYNIMFPKYQEAQQLLERNKKNSQDQQLAEPIIDGGQILPAKKEISLGGKKMPDFQFAYDPKVLA